MPTAGAMPPAPRECSIARSLDVVGQRWSPLVLRELLFGTTRFDAIAAATGAPRDMLTRRLRALEEAGLVTRRQYSPHPPRYDYELTDRGRDAAEILLTLLSFGDRHLSPEPPVVWRHRGPDGTDHDLDPVLTCRICGRPATEGLHDPYGSGAPDQTPVPVSPSGRAQSS